MNARLSLQRPVRRRVQKLDRRSKSADQRIRCRVVLKVAAGRSCNAASRELGCSGSSSAGRCSGAATGTCSAGGGTAAGPPGPTLRAGTPVAAAAQVTQRLVRLTRRMHLGQQPGAEQLRQLASIPPVGLGPHSGHYRGQRRGDDRAGDPGGAQLPLQGVAGRASPVAAVRLPRGLALELAGLAADGEAEPGQSERAGESPVGGTCARGRVRPETRRRSAGDLCRPQRFATTSPPRSRSSSRILVFTRSMATLLWPPSGMMTSAQRFDGSTNCMCMGRTLSSY